MKSPVARDVRSARVASRGSAVAARSPSGRQSKWRARLLLLALAAALSCLLALAGSASANIPAGEDQYLEQVPSGGGDTGKQNKDDFAKSLGGNGGVVNARDVRQAAAENRRAAKRSGGAVAAKQLGENRLPGGDPVTGALAAAGLGAFSSGMSLALLALILALGGGVVASRALRSRP